MVSFTLGIQAFKELASSAKALIQKSVKEGAYDDLTSQIKDAIDDQVLIKLSDQEVKDLSNHPHHFCYINYVRQPLSKSTKFRCVVNTSTLIPNISSTISIETKAPSKTLNIMETTLIRFILYPVVLIGDLRKAYHIFIFTGCVLICSCSY